jgi:hypothetical protein
VSPSPTRLHQSLALLLGYALQATCPDEFDVTQGVEIRVNSRRSLIPDVLVTSAAAAAGNPSHYQPRPRRCTAGELG